MSVGEGINTMSSPVLRIVLIIGLFLAWTEYNRRQAAAAARAECEASRMDEVVAEMERQREVSEAAIRAATEEAEKTREELAALEAERDEILGQLSQHDNGSCRIPPDILDRLRAIR